MTQTLIRRDIWDLSDQDPWHPVIQAYASAIAVMQKVSVDDPADPTGWLYQAAVHAVPTGEQGDAYRDQCQHQSWYFLPWHRMYLVYFERIVRAKISTLATVADDVKQTWALPYWNYGRGGRYATLPPAFRAEKTPSGAANPLYVAQRKPQVNAGYGLPTGIITAKVALGDLPFSVDALPGMTAGFGGPVTGWHHNPTNDGSFGDLEQTPHNDVHVYIGGNRGFMTRFETAPRDPIFWLHHANLDRLWTVWLGEQNPQRSNPTESAWLDESFKFHDEHGNSVSSTPGGVVDTVRDLGYSYEEAAPPPSRRVPVELAREVDLARMSDVERIGAAPVRVPAHPPELIGASEAPLTLAGERATVSLDISQPESPALRGVKLFALAPEPQHRTYLNVEGVSGDSNPGLSYGVYVNAPASTDQNAPLEAHHVGNLSFFGLERSGDLDSDHSGAPGLRHAYDITDLVSSLQAAGVWNPDKVSVTFEPLSLVPPEGHAELPEEEVPTVKIGRVSIYVE
jgi:tyrosinase